jgi:hypothetical protein
VNWLYSLAQPFVWHPVRILLVAAAWLVLALALFRAARRPLLVAAIAWAVFGLLEFTAWRERADIRVDLLFTWPALCLITTTCIVVAVRRVRNPRDSERGEAA